MIKINKALSRLILRYKFKIYRLHPKSTLKHSTNWFIKGSDNNANFKLNLLFLMLITYDYSNKV